MSTILNEILEWAQDKLEYWEQVLLDKLLKQTDLTNEDYQECLTYLLQDTRVEAMPDNRSDPSFSGYTVQDEIPNRRILLHSLANLQNINALVPGQKLTFDERLTIIYGKNGSGKSGYARVLGRAGFTRGDNELLRDILAEPGESTAPYAQIELSVDGNNKTIDFIGEDIALMRAFYMLDSTAINAHLKNQNELSFSPAGLIILKHLAVATDEVRTRLKTQIDRLKEISAPSLIWQEQSSISQKFNSVSVDTDLIELEKIIQFGREDEERLRQLDEEIASHGSENIAALIEERVQEEKDIHALQKRLINIGQLLSSEAIQTINSLIEDYTSTKEIIDQYSLNDFKHPQLVHIGTPEWHQFTEVAHKLADKQSNSYPQEGDVCLLCHQPLQRQAQEHLSRLWQFLSIGTQTQLRDLESKLDTHRELLRQLDLDFIAFDTVQYRYLKAKHPDLLSELETYQKQLFTYRQVILEATIQHEIITTHTLNNFSEHLEALIVETQNEISYLSNEDANAQLLEVLRQEKLELEHRRKLGEVYATIREHVLRLEWIAKAEKVGGNTRKITQKHNELFEKHVTKRYIELFDAMLHKLGRSLKVSITTKAQKGQTLKQIILKTHASMDKVKTEQVLSEGEKRAVAFADFMTEVELDTNCAGIILDDPVTSLDLDWRVVIAELLVEQARHRQVIVFTHDVPFLQVIKTVSANDNMLCPIHQITKGPLDEKPGYTHLNNAPILEQDYKSTEKAEEEYKRAKQEPDPSKHMMLLQDGMDALRTSYEALVVFNLLNGVIQRYDDRLSVGSLRKIVWDASIVEQICSTFEFLSRYVKGHLHVDNPPHQVLDLSLLRQKIDEFNDLRKKINRLKEGKQ